MRQIESEFISIHAPPRGATLLLLHWKKSARISIHAPPRGATRTLRNACSNFHHFNSRPSARGDTASSALEKIGTNFNSRPSARGDGQGISGWRRGSPISIHAPPRGATMLIMAFGVADEFQFTPLREGRPKLTDITTVQASISIHAPPRGATRRAAARRKSARFQFTPLREGRPGSTPTYSV